MEKENEGNVFNQISNFFTRYPQVTVPLITLVACGIVGLIIYLAPRFGYGQNPNTTSSALKFDLPTGSPQNQGAVEGANTQTYGPEEQSPEAPSSAAILDTPTAAASESATPTETPEPTSSPTSAPTATPNPTSTPAPTATPTPIPTVMPNSTPTLSPTPSE